MSWGKSQGHRHVVGGCGEEFLAGRLHVEDTIVPHFLELLRGEIDTCKGSTMTLQTILLGFDEGKGNIFNHIGNRPRLGSNVILQALGDKPPLLLIN